MQKSLPGQLTALLLPLLLLLSFQSFAGESDAASGLSATIQKARSAGTTFMPVDLFTPASGARHAGLLREETLLTPVYQHVSTLFKTRPQAITLSLKTAAGDHYTLELLIAHPLSDAPNMGVIDASGRHQVASNDGLHYQGVVAGKQRSIASMSVFANGDIMMLFATEDGNFNVGKLEDHSGNYILYNDRDLLQKITMPCGTAEKDYPERLKTNTGSKGTKAKMCNKVQLYWEGDYDLYRRKGNSLTTAQNYMTGLFNQMQTLYANEYIAVELKSLYIWSVSDDYPKTSSGPALSKFRSFWNNLGDTYDGNLAHLITMDSNGNGGLGFVDVLCNKSVGYSYSEVNGSFQNVPTYSWDAMVVTHETGHNLGSSHTHWCGWNTGAGGSCGAIDNCYTLESDAGCSTCPATYTTSTSGWRGTIMSYCHLSSVGINLANGFGPLPGDLIRANVMANTCLASIISAKLAPVSICSGNDGAINLTYNANNFAVPPIKYFWSTNDTVQNLAGLTAPGTYNVAIIDSNACYLELNTELNWEKKAGSGIAPAVHMPICCQSTTQKLTLRATAPTYIDFSCHTVAWLKTATPVTSYAGLTAAYSAAAAGDIMYSSNEAGINQAVGAALDVQPPATCTGPVTDYYTPFVTRKRRNALHVTGASTSSLFYSLGGVQIGGYTVILDQSALVSGCYLTDTPSARSLTVTVSGYTGRANKMTLVVMNASNQVLHSQVGLPGDGIYNIPMSIFNNAGAVLQQLRFRAFDFNCTTGGSGLTCITSACTINAERMLHYDSITHAMPLTSCVTESSIRVDFAPTACAPMSTPEIAKTTVPSLFPNPARHSVILKFTAAQAGSTVIRITDVTGKEVFARTIRHSTGAHTEEFNVNEWARGVYFVALSGTGVSSDNLKLVLE